MVKFKSKNSNLEVVFKSEGFIDETINFRGKVLTTSTNEINKQYYVRATIDPTPEINVSYMSEVQYLNLLELVTTDGNLFSLTTTEGDFYDNCFVSENISLTKNKNIQNKEKYRSGTLTISTL